MSSAAVAHDLSSMVVSMSRPFSHQTGHDQLYSHTGTRDDMHGSMHGWPQRIIASGPIWRSVCKNPIIGGLSMPRLSCRELCGDRAKNGNKEHP